MKKILPWIVASVTSLFLFYFLNASVVSREVNGLRLPFGWQGPYHKVLPNPVADFDQGLPLAFYATDHNYDSYYNNLAGILDVLVGLGSGIVLLALIKQLKKK